MNWIKTADQSYTLFCEETGEPYHSVSGAWSESLHVFIKPWLQHAEQPQKSFWRVLDVGFGLGLNWLACVMTAQRLGKKIEIVSLERDPLILQAKSDEFSSWLSGHLPEELCRLHALLKQQKAVSDQSGMAARLLMGEAADSLQKLIAEKSHFDLIMHDPFSPQKNSKCWQIEFFECLAQCCQRGSVLLTYSVARSVRDNLTACGFAVEKLKGIGQKREQLMAIKT